MAPAFDPLAGSGASQGPGGVGWGSASLAWTLLAGGLLLYAGQHAAAALAGALRSACTAIILRLEPERGGEQGELADGPDDDQHEQEQELGSAQPDPGSHLPATQAPGSAPGGGQGRQQGRRPREGRVAEQQQVTVVVTDVQNSTLLWESFPLEMNAAIEMHDSLMRRLIAGHRGVELLTEGDSFQAGCWPAAAGGASC
jgi:hypothetical protein